MNTRVLRAIANRRYRVHGPNGDTFTVGAVNLEDAYNYAREYYNQDVIKIWEFCGGSITVVEMTEADILAERTQDTAFMTFAEYSLDDLD